MGFFWFRGKQSLPLFYSLRTGGTIYSEAVARLLKLCQRASARDFHWKRGFRAYLFEHSWISAFCALIQRGREWKSA